MEFYIGQIIMFGGNFAIRNFMLAQGQLLAINSNQSLFSIYGTTYGGDGRTTFALPDLRGRSPLGQGNGPGLNPVALGEKAGREYITLTNNELPSHTHTLSQVTVQGDVTISTAEDEGTTQNPNGQYLALANDPQSGDEIYAYGSDSVGGNLNGGALANGKLTGSTDNAGGQRAFNTRNPFLGINYEVCLIGLYPSRS